MWRVACPTIGRPTWRGRRTFLARRRRRTPLGGTAARRTHHRVPDALTRRPSNAVRGGDTPCSEKVYPSRTAPARPLLRTRRQSRPADPHDAPSFGDWTMKETATRVHPRTNRPIKENRRCHSARAERWRRVGRCLREAVAPISPWQKLRSIRPRPYSAQECSYSGRNPADPSRFRATAGQFRRAAEFYHGLLRLRGRPRLARKGLRIGARINSQFAASVSWRSFTSAASMPRIWHLRRRSHDGVIAASEGSCSCADP